MMKKSDRETKYLNSTILYDQNSFSFLNFDSSYVSEAQIPTEISDMRVVSNRIQEKLPPHMHRKRSPSQVGSRVSKGRSTSDPSLKLLLIMGFNRL